MKKLLTILFIFLSIISFGQYTNNAPINWKNTRSVVDYGADTTGVTDATTAVQNCTNAVFAIGGGTVYFPLGKYKIAGALITSLNSVNPNCQIYIPLTSQAALGTAPVIKFLGQVPPNYNTSGISGTFPSVLSGVTLYSTITGSGSIPTVIGSPYAAQTFGNFNYTGFSIENITIKIHATSGGAAIAPTVGGLNAGQLETLEAINFHVCLDTALFYSASPTNAVYGIITPQIDNDAWTYLNRVSIEGMQVGISCNEHLNGDQVAIWSCNKALDINSAHHAMVFNHLLTAWNVYNINVNATANLSINNWAIEDYNGAYGAKWYNNTADINDGSNLLKGEVSYLKWLSGGANPTTLTNTGAGSLTIFDLYTNTTYNSQIFNNAATFSSTINKVTLTAPATAATLTLANNSSFITSGAFSTTLTATAPTTLTLPTTGTLATTTDLGSYLPLVGATYTTTTGNGLAITSSTVTTGNLVSLTNTGTAAASNTKTVLSVGSSGANGTSSQTTYAGQFTNTNTGSGTNNALYLSASGGSVNNGLVVNAGNVLIGTTTLSVAGATEEIKAATPYLLLNTSGSTGQQAVWFAKNGTNKWQVGSDFAANGTNDFYIYDQASSQARFYAVASSGTIYVGGNAYSANTPALTITSATVNKVGINLTPTKGQLEIAAGGTLTAPLVFTSGTNNTTAQPGAMEYNGTNLFFTRTGTTRETVITANAVNSVSPTSPNRTITVVIDGTTYYLAAKTSND